MNCKSMNFTAKRAMTIIMVVSFVLANCIVADASTRRLFRSGPIDIPVNTEREITTNLDVSNYSKIRVCVNNRRASVSRIVVRFLLIEGNETVGELEQAVVDRGSAPTKVFEAPGTTLRILVKSDPAPAAPRGSNTVDVVIYGSN